MIVAVPIETTMSVRSPKRNQAARRRAWSLGWVMPKVRKKAVASASKNRMGRWYAVGGVWTGKNPRRHGYIQYGNELQLAATDARG
jgi:hypothetical protein